MSSSQTTSATPVPVRGPRALSRKMLRVARMEFKRTAANKAFVVITIIGPFLIVAMSVLPSLLAMSGGGAPEPARIAVTGNAELASSLEPAFAASPITLVNPGGGGASADEQALRAALDADEVDGYVVLPADPGNNESIRFVTSGSPNLQLVGTLEGIIGQVVVGRRLAEAGFNPERVRSLTQPPNLDVRRIDEQGEEQGTDFFGLLFTGLAFTFLLYMTILLYGQSIGTSVIGEKRSKTVEIMLSSVSPRELLVGKIVGKAGASLLQYAIWIGMAVLFLQVLGPLVDVQVQLAGGAATYVYLVGFFLLAFLLYSSVYAALGAAAEDEQHLGQLAWPVIAFLIVPMVMIGAVTQNPDGVLPQVLSIFPLTAPIVMFLRLLLGDPALWEVLLSVGLLVASIAIVALIAAKIFRIGILMTGKRFSFGEIARWLRYRG